MLEGAKEYFGKFFEVKGGNRMNPLKKEEMPGYVRSVVDGAREALKQDGREHGYGEIPPSVDSIESLFEFAKQRVTDAWNRSVRPELDKKLVSWTSELHQMGDVPKDVISVFENPDVFESKMVIGQYGSLEGVREKTPHIWLELVALGSERQLAGLVVVQRWFREAPIEKKKQLVETFGLSSIDELDIIIDLSSVAGKFIDHGYMKQIELAVVPGGQMHSPIDLRARSIAAVEERQLRESDDMDTKIDPKIPKGLEYVYDIPSKSADGDIDILAFSDVFPFELGALQKSLERLSAKVHAMVTAGKLPETYIKLPGYLQAMADTYASKETDPEVVHKQYENLLTMCRELALSGCPIMLLPQTAPNVAGDASKTDIEVRIGFRTKEVAEFEKTIAPFVEIATRIRAENAQYCKEVKPMPPLFANYQPVAFGPNVFWHTRGEEGEEQILAHNNEVETVAIIKALPEFRRMFPYDTCTDQEFLAASKVDNSVHELGHTLIHTKDSAVTGRVGKSPVIEELKADSGNLKLIYMAYEAGAEVNVANQLRAKMGDICDYLKNKNPGSASGRKYFYGGATILQCLFDVGSVVERETGYELTNFQEGVAAVASLADEVLEFYRTGSIERVQGYFEHTMKQSVEDPRVQRFMQRLKI